MLLLVILIPVILSVVSATSAIVVSLINRNTKAKKMELEWEIKYNGMNAKWESKFNSMDTKWETKFNNMEAKYNEVVEINKTLREKNDYCLKNHLQNNIIQYNSGGGDY